MELSEAKEIFKEWLEYNKEHKDEIRKADTIIAVQETILKALDNSISKDKVRKVYADYFERVRHYEEHHLEKDEYYHRDKRICSILKKLLGE